MSINIIGGQLNKLEIIVPKSIIESIRPTSSIARKSIFDTISKLFKHDTIFIDLFAGTGIVGFESISRGIKNTIFIEKSNINCKILHENTKIIKKFIPKVCINIKNMNAINVHKKLNYLYKKIDFLFIDPPYNITNLFVSEHLNDISFISWCGNAIVILETSAEYSRKTNIEEFKDWNILKKNKVGQSVFYFLQTK